MPSFRAPDLVWPLSGQDVEDALGSLDEQAMVRWAPCACTDPDGYGVGPITGTRLSRPICSLPDGDTDTDTDTDADTAATIACRSQTIT